MPAQKVLVVGGGVAGWIAAYWLAKSDFDVTVIERSRADQKLGQGIEIEEPALKVVKAMGVLPALREKKTVEKGFELVDEKNRTQALFAAGRASPTGELELMRGDLTEVLYKAADQLPNVTSHFQTTIQSLWQTEEKAFVEMKSRATGAEWTDEFDFVIGADGAKSRTRQMLFGPDEKTKCLHPVGGFVSYFSIPKEDRDLTYSKLCHFPGRRIIWMRPVAADSEVTSVYLIKCADNEPTLRAANASGDRQKQKEAFAELYSGVGWETPRIIEHMLKSDNFYSDELQQVKLDTWSQNRVALVGDSAWAPTPFTGRGNHLAIIGGWVIAQELARHRSPVAFEEYNERLRQYVKQCQAIPLNGNMPKYVNPESATGIWVVRRVFGTISLLARALAATGLMKLIPSPEKTEDYDLKMEKELLEGK